MLPAVVLAAAMVIFSVSVCRAQWDSVRSFIGSGGTGGYSVSSFTVSQTVGESIAGISGGGNPSGSVLSGYLSQIPSNTLNFSLLRFESTAAVSSEGTLWGMEPAGSVKLYFSNELSSSAAAAGVIVTELMDHSGNETRSTAAASVSVGQQNGFVALTPVSGAWAGGSLFAVYYSSAMVDLNGLPLAAGTTHYFTTIMNHLQDNVAATPGELGVRVSVPAGAYSSDFMLMVSTAQSAPAITVANAKLASSQGNIPQPLKVLSLNARDDAGKPLQPGTPCILTFTYRDENGDGVVDGTFPPVKSERLTVWRLDDTGKTWVKQTGARFDASAKKVSLSVEHFSSYALLAVPDTDRKSTR